MATHSPPELDFRDLPLEIRSASPAAGERYWRIRKAVALPPEESFEMHHVFVRCFRDGERVTGVRVRQFWPDGDSAGPTEAKPMQEFGDWNAPLFGDWKPDQGPGPYGVEVADGTPSEALVGMGLPRKQHFSYVVEFEEVVAGETDDDDTPDEEAPDGPKDEELTAALRSAAEQHRSVLQHAMIRDGFAPTSSVFQVTHDDTTYVAQCAGRLGSTERRIYYHVEGQPGAVSHVEL